MTGKKKKPAKRGPGRPPSEEGPREEKLFVRLHPDEAQALQTLADRAKVPAATLFRDVAVRHARESLSRIAVIEHAVRQAEALADKKGPLQQRAKATVGLLGLRLSEEIRAARTGDSPPPMDAPAGELDGLMRQLQETYGKAVLSMGELMS